MSYQVSDLKQAQELIDRLTRALNFWLPDQLPVDDIDYDLWIRHLALSRGRLRSDPERCHIHGADLASEHGPKFPYSCPWCAGVA